MKNGRSFQALELISFKGINEEKRKIIMKIAGVAEIWRVPLI